MDGLPKPQSMPYTPEEGNLMRQRAVNYLEYYEEKARPYEIADAIGSDSIAYTRSECNDLAEEGVIEKHYSDRIIGYPMPNGEVEVLGNYRAKLLALVKKYESFLPFSWEDVKDVPTPNLRTLLESELVTGDPRPLKGRKVSFSYDVESAEA